MYGSLQATCPYHKKSESTGCKKTVKLRVGTHEHIDEVMWALKHWCNDAKSHDFQRWHVGLEALDLDCVPGKAFIESRKLDIPVPDDHDDDDDIGMMLMMMMGVMMMMMMMMMMMITKCAFPILSVVSFVVFPVGVALWCCRHLFK